MRGKVDENGCGGEEEERKIEAEVERQCECGRYEQGIVGEERQTGLFGHNLSDTVHRPRIEVGHYVAEEDEEPGETKGWLPGREANTHL